MYSVHHENGNSLVSTTDIYLLISHCHKFNYMYLIRIAAYRPGVKMMQTEKGKM